jgi:RNA polymerase sigma-70 factor (ECF subfamily)
MATPSREVLAVTRDTAPDLTLPQPRVAVEDDVLQRLLAGDERAFAEVVRSWSPMMLRVARFHVSTEASAEEIVQETWMAVVRGLEAFEGRSSLRTWVFRILTNLAKTRGVREARTLPMSALAPETVDDGPAIDADRFRPADDEWAGHWTSVGAPTSWPTPERSAVGSEIRARVAEALARLPERQRLVVTLRDVHGMDSDEVCTVLGVSPANQRVLLHRGRAHVRAELEDYYRGRDDGE